MRFTVARKIVFGLAAISVIGILAMLAIYAGLNAVGRAVHELAVEEQPFNAAAYEMEVNVNGIGFAVMKYLATREPKYRALVDEDHGDFDKYHATYVRLAKTERERELARTVSALYAEYKVLSYSLMQTRDRQEAQFANVSTNLERIHRLIDDRLQPAAGTGKTSSPGRFAAALSAANLQIEIAELGYWVANYERVARPETRQLILEKLVAFSRSLAQFQQLSLGTDEKRVARTVSAIFEHAAVAIEEIVALEDLIVKELPEFIGRRVTMDELFDEQIQPLALRALDQPRAQAEQAADQVLRTMRYLIPAFLLSAVIVGYLFIRFIIRPLNVLKTGTDAISRGDLAYRITRGNDDEFGDLAVRFNHMLDELESTTVSKDLLLESEKKLQESVIDLRHEISERERAELERRRLEEDLVRSAAMAAMGAITAGVAHEVRNPLFGISSTLDAMQVRFSSVEGSEPYLDVLRAEVNRLSKLMGDLLEYGKPVALEISLCTIGEPIAQALAACSPLAGRAGVTIEHRASATESTSLPVDRARLGQVFQNLLDNAIHFSPRGAIVTIATFAVEDTDAAWLECTIADCGPGFQREDMEHVFEPFFTRRRGGTGLGLSIVRRIVEAHGGTIHAANRPEGGAIMTVRLPASPVSGARQRTLDGTQQDPDRR